MNNYLNNTELYQFSDSVMNIKLYNGGDDDYDLEDIVIDFY